MKKYIFVVRKFNSQDSKLYNCYFCSTIDIAEEHRSRLVEADPDNVYSITLEELL